MERKSMINIRGTYSERNKIKNISNIIQIDEFDDRTRNRIANAIFDILNQTFNESYVNRFQEDYCMETLEAMFNKYLICDLLGEFACIDVINTPYDWNENLYKINEIIDKAPYYEVLDVIESICNWLVNEMKPRVINYPDVEYKLINKVFKEENVGYCFINKIITPITDQVEIDEIEKVINNKLDGAKTHIEKALCLFVDRDNPDYKNCIKESISAVESVCCYIVGNDNATLGQALSKLEKNKSINSKFKGVIDSLYKFTNQQGGIRHSEGEKESVVTSYEAKFYLVTCSAIVNALIEAFIEGK